MSRVMFLSKDGTSETLDMELSLDNIYDKLEVQSIDYVLMGYSDDEKTEYGFLIDDEGMLVENLMDNLNIFSIRPYRMGIFSQPLFGNLLLVATDLDGEYVDIDEATARKILKDSEMLI